MITINNNSLLKLLFKSPIVTKYTKNNIENTISKINHSLRYLPSDICVHGHLSILNSQYKIIIVSITPKPL